MTVTEDLWRLFAMIWYAASTVAIAAAAWKYYHSRTMQSGETLRQLEERFVQFHAAWQLRESGTRMPPITRAIEQDGAEFRGCGLESAIRKGLEGRPTDRDERERAWIPRLDELLRFLMIVSAMEKHRLLKSEALWDAYHYWFRTVNNNRMVRAYVADHFPVLHGFLDRNSETLAKYERLHESTRAIARTYIDDLPPAEDERPRRPARRDEAEPPRERAGISTPRASPEEDFCWFWCGTQRRDAARHPLHSRTW